MSTTQECLPADPERATLVGRLWLPGVGPTLVALGDGALHDLSELAPTASELFELSDPAGRVRDLLGAARRPPLAQLDAVLANSIEATRDASRPWLLAPCDLQAIKASGVTF